MLLSQDDFARALRTAGERVGLPNEASKRLVQRWEAGTITSPRPAYARALEVVTRLPIGALGFTVAVPPGDLEPSTSGPAPGRDAEPGPGPSAPAAVPGAAPGLQDNRSGVWLSRYEYYSNSRDATFIDLHYVIVLQHADRLTVRSLPGSSDSQLTMDLTVDGTVVTGTWVEQTAPQGQYRGARYHGAVQLLVEPTGRRLAGRWIGFGKNLDVNTGPWELTFEDASTNKATSDCLSPSPTPTGMSRTRPKTD